ncbi:MAG TPA: phytanoyl-CoA dioxygenase family protein [Chthonomonadaceae bacterium]|nr:phytanoyl-CoA dioxygenase family protein [Chthonomonadaceae bacterium]
MDIQALADEIRMNGYVILEQAIPKEKIAEMLERFDPLLEAKRASEPSNRGANRFQMHLPFELPFADPILYENPSVMAIVENLFGKDIILTYFASDTPFPGSDYQRVHLDCRLPFPEAAYGVPVYSLVVNAPLVDFTEENGPLEMWPGGTHLIGQPKDLEHAVLNMPSVRPLLKTGDLLLRDPRVWHRGTPSRGARSRPNIALVYSRGWFRFENHPVRIRIPRATYEAFSDAARAMFRYCAILEPDGALHDFPS